MLTQDRIYKILRYFKLIFHFEIFFSSEKIPQIQFESDDELEEKPDFLSKFLYLGIGSLIGHTIIKM